MTPFSRHRLDGFPLPRRGQVVKDAANHLGKGMEPAVKAVAKAVAEGIIEAQREQQPKQ